MYTIKQNKYIIAVVLKLWPDQNHLGRSLNDKPMAPSLRLWDLVGLEWAMRICIPNKLSADAETN